MNLLIREAHEARASDIHFEAAESGPVVRFRIDGVLSPATPPPRGLQAGVISRLKLIASLDISERRTPQDGRIRVSLEDCDLDLRVSTLPTIFGESIVLRLLEEGSGPAGLEGLGMDPDVLASFLRAVQSAHGVVLATGPTGSGKTTTLYGAVRSRRVAHEKIVTIEDPVEYRLAGVTQVPVNNRAGVTFSTGLRAVLRQDPDVIMVGETRDAETARIAVQAAMTGHVVFSTVHTNDAASAVTRLVDLGIEPYMVAATLQGVLAQRLVRRVCGHCASDVAPDEDFQMLCRSDLVVSTIRAGEGCSFCRGTGFRGRLGIFEYLPVDDVVRRQIVRSPDAEGMRDLAREAGMRTMKEDGLSKVLSGLTTPSEVLRAVQT